MPDEVTAAAGPADRQYGPHLILTGPIGRAAPTRIAPSGVASARSRRWPIAAGVVVAGLLAGASAALTSAAPGPAHPAPAVARQSHPRQPHNVAGSSGRDDQAR